MELLSSSMHAAKFVARLGVWSTDHTLAHRMRPAHRHLQHRLRHTQLGIRLGFEDVFRHSKENWKDIAACGEPGKTIAGWLLADWWLIGNHAATIGRDRRYLTMLLLRSAAWCSTVLVFDSAPQHTPMAAEWETDEIGNQTRRLSGSRCAVCVLCKHFQKRHLNAKPNDSAGIIQVLSAKLNLAWANLEKKRFLKFCIWKLLNEFAIVVMSQELDFKLKFLGEQIGLKPNWSGLW